MIKPLMSRFWGGFKKLGLGFQRERRESGEKKEKEGWKVSKPVQIGFI